MAAGRPATIQEGRMLGGIVGVSQKSSGAADPLDESLLSMEKLDRSSPDLWPEQIPGLSDFMRLRTPQPPTPTEQAQRQLPPALWTQPFNQEDVQYMQYLGGLATSSIILEVKKLHDLAYKLGVEEAKEMTRGKFLNIFKSRRQR